MGKTWALQDAKNHFSEVVDRALEDGPQTVTRHGREAVVVVAAAEYKKMTQPTESLVEFMQRSPLYGAEDVEFERDKSLTREQPL
ncbi:MAG TPA: type II toxin-antitoxin system prevent-host-death family antitoxin [Rhodocyclaceae bacterium]|nr:type II toxin-antitoxin system prevent-host-death family antitoxin [Rhodocyclaceae bacterium]